MYRYLDRFALPFGLLAVLILVNFPVLFFNQTLEPTYAPVLSPYGARWMDRSTPADIMAPQYREADPGGATGGDSAYARFVKDSVLSGEYPWWNPYNFLGIPFAEAATGVLYPPNWLRLLLPPQWFDLIYLVNWLLAAIFTAMLARSLSVGRMGAFFSGVMVFSLNHFSIYLSTNSISATLCWFPLLLYGIERSFSANFSRWSWLSIVIAIYGLTNGFHPGPWLFGLIFGAIYFLARGWIEPRFFWKRLIYVSTSGFAGLALSAFQFIPFLDLMFSGRPEARPFGSNFFQLPSLVQVIFKNFFGPMGAEWAFGSTGYFLDYRTGFLFLPTALLILLWSGAVSSTKMWKAKEVTFGLVAVGLISFLWTYRVPPLSWLSYLPVLKRLNMCYSPGIFNCVFAVLGGLYLEKISQKPDFARAAQKISLFFLGLSVIGLFVSLALVHHFKSDPTASALLRRETLPGVFAVLMISMSLFFAFRSGKDILKPLIFSCLVIPTIALFNVLTIESAIARRTYGAIVFVFVFFGLFLFQKFWRRHQTSSFVFVALSSLSIYHFSKAYPSFGRRVDVFAEPPYVQYIMRQNPSNIWRTWGVESYFWPNTNMPAKQSSANLLVNTLLPWDETLLKVFTSTQPKINFLEGVIEPGGSPPVLFKAQRKLFDYLSIRYLVSPRGDWDSEVILPLRPDGRPQEDHRNPFGYKYTPVAVASPLSFHVACDASRAFDSIAIFLSTYAQKIGGDIKVELKDLKGHLLGAVTRSGTQLGDNSNFKFRFGREINCSTGPFQATISYSGGVHPPGVWRNPENDIFYHLQRPNGEEGLGEIFFDPKTDARVWENRQAQPRVYFTSDIKLSTTWEEALQLFLKEADLRKKVFVTSASENPCPASRTSEEFTMEDFKLTSSSASAKVKTSSAGMLVFVDSFNKGWRATVNGQESKVYQVNGAFRGVCLPSAGTFEVVTRYRPAPFGFISLLFGIGVLISLCLFVQTFSKRFSFRA